MPHPADEIPPRCEPGRARWVPCRPRREPGRTRAPLAMVLVQHVRRDHVQGRAPIHYREASPRVAPANRDRTLDAEALRQCRGEPEPGAGDTWPRRDHLSQDVLVAVADVDLRAAR